MGMVERVQRAVGRDLEVEPDAGRNVAHRDLDARPADSRAAGSRRFRSPAALALSWPIRIPCH
jgi:hypothetical protein